MSNRRTAALVLFLFFLMPVIAFSANAQENNPTTDPFENEKPFDFLGYMRYLIPATVEAQSGKIGIIEAGGEGTYNFKAMGKLPVGISAAIDYVNIDKTIDRTLPTSFMNVGITLEAKAPLLNIKNTYFAASVNPSFAADQYSFGIDSFLMPFRLVAIYVHSEKLIFIGGAEFLTNFDNDTQGVGGVIYKPTDKLEMHLMTDYPHILYKVNDKLELLAEGQWVLYNQFRTRLGGDNNVLLEYREAWVGGGFHYKPFKNVDTSFSAGGVFNRQLKFEDAGVKVDIDKGFYLQGLAIISF